jgi:hypothetical protein
MTLIRRDYRITSAPSLPAIYEDRIAQDLVGLPQFAERALQRLYLVASSVGTPPRLPLSTSAFFTHSCSVCGTQPILFSAIDTTAAHREW